MDSKLSFIVNQYEGFTSSVCVKCGFEHFFQKEQSTMISGKMYGSDADYQDDLILALNHKKMLQWHHRYALRFISKSNLSAGIRILDVGCHTGFFVKEVLNLGFDAYGIDFNKKSVNFGLKAYNLDGRISLTTLEDIRSTGNRFEIISLFEVIEHVHNPRELIESILDLLQPGGILILSTPNKNMCWRPPLDYPPHHLSRFTPTSIQSLLLSLGLSIVDHAEQMSLFELTRNFFGTKFRNQSAKSFRGGEFKYHELSLWIRRLLNTIRPIAYGLFHPVDILLYQMGLRYIGQVIIARK